MFKKLTIIGVFLGILFLSLGQAFANSSNTTVAEAQEDGSAAMAYVAETASETIKSIGDSLVEYGQILFFALAVISIVLTLGQTLLSQQMLDLNLITVQLLRMMMLVGFVSWLLHDASGLLATLISDFTSLGNSISNSGITVKNPSQFLDIGWEKAWEVWSSAEIVDGQVIASIIKIFITFFVVLFVCCEMVAIAVTMLLVSLFFYYLTYGGLFFLGFFGINYTRDFAINYLKALLANAVRYYAMIVLCGIMINTLKAFVDNINVLNTDAGYAPFLAFCLIIYVMKKIIIQVPQMISDLISSVTIQNPLTGGEVMAVTLSAGAAAGTLGLATGAFSAPFIWGATKQAASSTKSLVSDITSSISNKRRIFKDFEKGADDIKNSSSFKSGK